MTSIKYLAELIKSEQGSAVFNFPITTASGVRLQAVKWRVEMQAGIRMFTVSLTTLPKAFSGFERPLDATIAYDDKQPDFIRQQAMRELIQTVEELALCRTCLVRNDDTALAGGDCFSCHLRRELNPKTIDCSICQEPATGVYYSTGCGHHFHYACIAPEFDRVYLLRNESHRTAVEMKCPNCRCDLEGEYVQVMNSLD